MNIFEWKYILRNCIIKFKYKKGLITIDICIFNKYYTFLIDSGSEKSFLLPKKKFEKYKIKKEKYIKINGIGKDKIIKFAYIFPKIIIDGVSIYNAEFLIQNKNLMFFYLNIDGIIGFDILKQFDFYIDFTNKIFNIGKFHLQNNPHCSQILSDKQMVIKIGYNNKNYRTLIDLGANNSIISTDIIPNINLISNKNSIVLGINGFSVQKVSEIRNIIFSFGKNSFKVKKVYVGSFKYNWSIKLGTDSLNKYKVYFINSKREVIISWIKKIKIFQSCYFF